MLAEHDGDAQIISGGQSLVPAMNLRLASPQVLVDICHLDDLRKISVDRQYLRIGARVTHSEVIESGLVVEHLGILAKAGMHIAHATVRANGTMGGSLALSDPAAEWPVLLSALDGSVLTRRSSGSRTISWRELFKGLYSTALASDEVIVEILFPLPTSNERHGFAEFARQVGAFALAAAAVKVELDGDVIRACSGALGGCGPTPMRFELTSLLGTCPSALDVKQAVGELQLNPTSDIHVDSVSRASIARAVIKRAVLDALQPDARN